MQLSRYETVTQAIEAMNGTDDHGADGGGDVGAVGGGSSAAQYLQQQQQKTEEGEGEDTYGEHGYEEEGLAAGEHEQEEPLEGSEPAGVGDSDVDGAWTEYFDELAATTYWYDGCCLLTFSAFC